MSLDYLPPRVGYLLGLFLFFFCCFVSQITSGGSGTLERRGGVYMGSMDKTLAHYNIMTGVSSTLYPLHFTCFLECSLQYSVGYVSVT